MGEELAAGTYVEETVPGLPPIEGVAADVAALVGEAERGPAGPVPIAGPGEYERHFGEGGPYLPDAVRGFFENGGRRLYVSRLAGPGSATARIRIRGLTFEALGPGSWGNRIRVELSRDGAAADGTPLFMLRISYWSDAAAMAAIPPASPDHAEIHAGLAWQRIAERLVRDSTLVRAKAGSSRALPAGLTRRTGLLRGGRDGAAADSSAIAAALERLRDVAEISLVAAPGLTDEAAADALIDHAESCRRFAVLDGPRSAPATLDPRGRRPSADAAFYVPWIGVVDQPGAPPRFVPPSGAVLGIYARTDSERGVWKAPANEVVRGAAALEHEVGREQQDRLNPIGVNLIRSFAGRGIRLWGARTLSADPEWKYVNGRRYFRYLERWLEQGIKWAVFEANDEATWAKVRSAAAAFLRREWQRGALAGVKPEEAFFVKCDRTTMTQADLNSGRLVCLIGYAPVKPAEFVIFRIGQWTADAPP